MGADTRSERSEQIRALSSLLQRAQCGVALDALGESGCSFGTELVKVETAGVRCREAGAEVSAGVGVDRMASTRAAAHSSEVTALPLSPSQSLVMPSAV